MEEMSLTPLVLQLAAFSGMIPVPGAGVLAVLPVLFAWL